MDYNNNNIDSISIITESVYRDDINHNNNIYNNNNTHNSNNNNIDSISIVTESVYRDDINHNNNIYNNTHNNNNNNNTHNNNNNNIDSISIITESVYRDNNSKNNHSRCNHSNSRSNHSRSNHSRSNHSRSNHSRKSNNSSKSNRSRNNRTDIIKYENPINKNIIVDVAVLYQEYSELNKLNNDHIINLDSISISIETFQNIYFSHGEFFAINKNYVVENNMQHYVSFLPEHQTINKKRFCLLEQLYSNIELDLNISRDCFTVESKVEFSNEISNIRYMYDVNVAGLLSALTWSNIIEIIKNYSLLNSNNLKQKKEDITIIFVVSVVFKTPTPGVKNTIVRFNYIITNI